jgi:hypothetical protein
MLNGSLARSTSMGKVSHKAVLIPWRTVALWSAIVFVIGCNGNLETDAENQQAGPDTGPGLEYDAAPDGGASDDVDDPVDEDCVSMERFFMREVWPKVASPNCAACHNPQGMAYNSGLILHNEQGYSDFLERNIEAMASFARQRVSDHDNKARLLLKPTNTIPHDGGRVLAADSEAYRILEEFVARIDEPKTCVDPPLSDFFEGVVMLEGYDLLRKSTLSLAGRLPTADEIERFDRDGQAAFAPFVDDLLREPGFFERLKEGFNDIFLTDYYLIHSPDQRLYDQHYPDRRWWEALTELTDGERNNLRNHARYGLAREPLELIAHIVRNEQPFTELLTADYIMVNPYSARSYGVFDRVEFDDPEDREEFRPVRLPAIAGTGMREDHYPHAGILSSYMYLNRYPSTNTNRNRHRAAMFLDQFLATNILESAPQAIDPTEADHFFNPVMDSSDCTVCHAVIDPIAGAFQNYNNAGQYRPPNTGWFRDMSSPGFNNTLLPPDRMWEGLRWLGHLASNDRRFEIAIVGHVFQLVTGQRPLELPRDVLDPSYYEQLRAYEVQRAFLRDVARDFAQGGFNLKTPIAAIVLSPYFRAANVAPEAIDATRERELASLGTARLLHPEGLQRKIQAIFGDTWRQGTTDMLSRGRYLYLYGGIDSDLVTVRLGEPNGVIAGIARLMANDLACQHTARDLQRPAAERLLFPTVELADVPGTDAEMNGRILETIVHLHERVLGERLPADHIEIQATFELFSDLVADGQRGLEAGDPQYFVRLRTACRGTELRDDPHYTIQAWMGVMTYLLSTYEFLYE